MIEIHSLTATGRLEPVHDRAMTFPAGEQHVAECSREPGEDLAEALLIVVRGTHADDYAQAGMWIDLAHQRSQKALLAIPYLPGARQDRGRPFGAKVYANIINALDADRVICLDPHSPVMPSLIENLTTIDSTQVVVDSVADMLRGFSPTHGLAGVICPDKGAAERSRKVADALGVRLFHATKHRDFATGRLSGFTCDPLPEAGILLVVDDICDGGGTFRGLAAATGLPAERLALFVTHGVFSGVAPGLRESYDQIITTDSHPGHAREGVATSVVDVLPYLVGVARRAIGAGSTAVA